MAKTIETQFISYLLKKHPELNKKKIKNRSAKERRRHVRFSRGCGVETEEDFLALFNSMNYSPAPIGGFSKSYEIGGYVKWNDTQVGVLYGIAPEGKSERKRWAPGALGLNGYETDSKVEFKNKVIKGLNDINENDETIRLLISLLGDAPILETQFLKDNRTKIVSDFGEIMSAYKHVSDGYRIRFSKKSNEAVNDYYILINNAWTPVSVKDAKTSNKVVLSALEGCFFPATAAGKFLKAVSEHDKDNFFKYAAEVSPQIKILANIIGGTTQNDIQNYVNSHSYNDFYNQIKSNSSFILKKKVLGIPREEPENSDNVTPREHWARGFLDPFNFTLNTLTRAFFGRIDGITSIVFEYLRGIVFIMVEIKNGVSTFTEQRAEHVNRWTLEYHSRATAAWGNWMGIKPVEEKK